MMGESGIKRELAKGDADYAVIESAIGLYDGYQAALRSQTSSRFLFFSWSMRALHLKASRRKPWIYQVLVIHPYKLTIAAS